MIYLIYKITNLINNKIYYGQTHNSIQQRFNRHIFGSTESINKMPICKAIAKYGKDNFKIELIKKCNSQKELDAWETLFIIFAKQDKYGCYNVLDFCSSTLGLKHTEETKKKMSKPKSEQHKLNMRKAFKGRKLTQLSIDKLKYSLFMKKINNMQIIFTNKYKMNSGSGKKFFKPNIEAKQYLDSILSAEIKINQDDHTINNENKQ